jgi:hypothetical protein
MKTTFYIENYANWEVLDLFEIDYKGHKYKRFRIMKSELLKILAPNEATLLRQNQLKSFSALERTVIGVAMSAF